MDRINGAGTIDIGAGRRGFRDEDLEVGQEGTEVTALWLNMTQEEIIYVIEAAGLILDPGDWTQLWQALQILGLSAGARSRRWVAVISMTLSSAPGGPAAGDTYLIPAGATGIWAAHAGKIAEWSGSAWFYFTPSDGHGISLPDGRVFERISGVYVEKLARDAQSGKWTYAVAGGTANALTATLVPSPENLASLTGSSFRLRTGASANGTGGVTLNLNGLGALAVTKLDGSPLLPGDLPANSIAEFAYTGTSFMLMSAGSPAKPVLNGVVLYSVAGSYSWVCPAGVTKVRVKIWGGGGGGGGSGTAAGSAATSAGGAGYAEKLLDVVPGTSYPVVVGAGGAAGPGGGSPAAGGTGGTSSFGGVVSATGGTGGVAANGAPQTATGAGGNGSGGDFNVPGGGGGVAYQIGANYLMPSGGYTFQTSVNQQALTGGLLAGRQGVFPGGGAGGGFLGGAGGVGGSGLVILEF